MLKRVLIPSAFLVSPLLIADNTFANSKLLSQPPSPQAVIAQNSLSERTTEKPRIAVLDFDFSSVGNPSLLSLINGGADGVGDLLVNALVEGGQYTVVERSRIQSILAEQNLGASGRIDASTAAEIGKILGVRAVMIGSVTQFDLQKQNAGGGIFGVGASTQDTDAEVAINVRLVDTNTAEILYTTQGKGNKSQSDTQLRAFGVRAGASTSNDGKLLTLATEEAIQTITQNMNTQVDTIAALQQSIPDVEALVASVSGNTIILNKGKKEGYREGMVVSIERVTQEVKDPETGEVIRTLTTKLGEVKLTDVDAKSSLGQWISGTATPQVGDLAKPMRQN
ncbi:Curli production assembly/transport component CsgG [Halothece sp. PCC 7418]|uniref:CsgG/HfaB family protein n=1 Tax=Halothece sp. (strain PCC 7418) TaxID=65093 RepID=UPI0002A08652|nr:CsgG/HfaB family protein [Halothece sp. PCC 7418]AFZ45726.1 Curli production assembly/transport component CsgG [Halothece sp. PCC 7418]